MHQYPSDISREEYEEIREDLEPVQNLPVRRIGRVLPTAQGRYGGWPLEKTCRGGVQGGSGWALIHQPPDGDGGKAPVIWGRSRSLPGYLSPPGHLSSSAARVRAIALPPSLRDIC